MWFSGEESLHRKRSDRQSTFSPMQWNIGPLSCNSTVSRAKKPITWKQIQKVQFSTHLLQLAVWNPSTQRLIFHLEVFWQFGTPSSNLWHRIGVVIEVSEADLVKCFDQGPYFSTARYPIYLTFKQWALLDVCGKMKLWLKHGKADSLKRDILQFSILLGVLSMSLSSFLITQVVESLKLMPIDWGSTRNTDMKWRYLYFRMY